MNTKFNNTTILTIAASIITIVGIIYFVARPLWRGIIDVRQSEPKYATEMQQLEQTLTTMRKLDKERTTLESYTKIAAVLVPPEPQLEAFTIQLESLLNQSQINDANFEITELSGTNKNAAPASSSTPVPTSTSTTKSKSKASNTTSLLKNTKAHQFSISGTSSLSKITELLKLLKNMDRLIEINAITITNKEDDNLTFQISGNAFSKSSTTTQTTTLSNLQTLLDEANQYIANRTSYGSPINPNQETGFGRDNPFKPY